MSKLGENFERLIASIQQKIDPSSQVTHDEYILDRLNQRRQFDVVIRGNFAGQSMLGVIECKDLKRRVGTPEIDAFCTKAQDINANFKIMASKSGFTKTAVTKARHYGIRIVSLLDPVTLGADFPIGDWWIGKVYYWKRIHIQPYQVGTPEIQIEASPESLLINDGRVIDWFKNHLLTVGHTEKNTGWVINFKLTFKAPINLKTTENKSYLCSSIDFHAERMCDEFERFVSVSADALVDWHTGKASIPSGTQISTEAVPTDIRTWDKRDKSKNRISSMFPVHVEAHEKQFEFSPNAPDMESF